MACEYGVAIMGLFTWPYVAKSEHHPLSIAVSILFALLPLMYFIGTVLSLAWLVLVKHPKTRQESLGNVQVVAMADMSRGTKSHQWRLQRLCRALHSLFFLCLTTVLSLGQQHIFASPRPHESCLGRSGMPDGLSLWAVGQMTIIFLALMQRSAMPFLRAQEERRRGPDRPLPEDDWYKDTISYGDVSFWMFVAMFGLSGVPVSRLVLQDSHYDQIMVGGFEGMIAGCASHICYSKLVKTHWDSLRQHVLEPCLERGCTISWGRPIEKFLKRLTTIRLVDRLGTISGFEFLGADPKAFVVTYDPDPFEAL